jgi:hypothetical protein
LEEINELNKQLYLPVTDEQLKDNLFENSNALVIIIAGALAYKYIKSNGLKSLTI